MSDQRRARRVASEEVRAELQDGSFYRVRDGNQVRWFKVSVVFYPRVRWYAEEYDLAQRHPLPGTRQPLDDALKARLETWL